MIPRLSRLLLVLGFLSVGCLGALAATKAVAPQVLDVWPGTAPGEKDQIGDEKLQPPKGKEQRPAMRLTNVTRPTLTVYKPDPAKDTGTAVVICPGGGYNILAMDLEGEEVATWLNSIGVTGIVLKYRVPRREGTPKGEPPLQPLMDAQRAVSLVRAHAAQWKIAADRIGILGFSAGGHLSAAATTNWDRRQYEPIDDVDQVSCRPDFAVLLYPAYLVQKDGTLSPQIRVDAKTPPLFFVHADDDRLTSENSVAMYLALKRAGVPAELHVYAAGGHGFGLRPSANPCCTWPDRCRDWMKSRGLLDRSSSDPFEINRRLGRGVNIIGYDPLWKSRDKGRFQEKHFRLIHEAGFQHVRINLHPWRDGKIDEKNRLSADWLETLDWAIRQARQNQLLAILDLHEFQEMGRDAEGNHARLLATWKQLADRYQNEPDDVLFEILNEPNGKLTPELWNQYLREALAVIRQSNPSRAVVVGPAHWNDVDYLDKLQLPDDDRHLVTTVHYYKPMAFTHQGASWTGQKDKVGVPWNGTEQDLVAIERDFDKVQAWSQKHQRPVYLGEFGAYDKGDLDSRVRYTSDVARAAEERGWSWGYWQFEGNFIVFDMKGQQWFEPILHALIPLQK